MSGESLQLRVRRKLGQWADRGRNLLARWFGRTPPVERPQRIVFVCRGNICRSSFAEGWVRRHWPHIETASAGVHVRHANPAPDAAIEAAQRLGIDLREHRSKSIQSLPQVDRTLYIVFEPWHAEDEAMRARPDAAGTFELGAWNRPRRAIIQDPYGRDVATFISCYRQIVAALERLMGRWNDG